MSAEYDLVSLFGICLYIAPQKFSAREQLFDHPRTFSMTTKPPSAVSEFPPESIEKIAYSAVADIPAQEPNDLNRLGYNVWAWLVDRKGTLEQAIRTAGARTHIPHREVARIISQRLKEKGLEVS